MRLSRVVACAAVLAGMAIVAVPESAEARPQYLKQFAAKYPKVADAAKEAKCGVCHYGDSKKNNNDYGKAVKDALGDAKNVKNDDAIVKALDAAGKQMSETHKKTFAELIEDGKLPGTNPAE